MVLRTLCVKVPEELLRRLEVVRKELGVSVSEEVRAFLEARVRELERLVALKRVRELLGNEVRAPLGFSEGATVMVRDSARRVSPTQVRG